MPKKSSAPTDTNRAQAAQIAIEQIQDRFGKGSIMKLGEAKAMNVEAISTGCLSLDIALGVGGVPKGRVIEIYGPEASGKTTLAQHIVAEVQKNGGIAAFVDAEHALDPEYAKKIGVNIDELFLTAQLSETYLPVVKKGEEVTITFPTYPGIKMSKPIHRTGNVINKENRTFEVQVKLDNPTGVLKPNMLANMEINDYNNEQALVVPSVLIRNDMKGSYIYLADKKDVETVARKQYVTIGKSFKDKTEVVAGLTEGDIYITDGYSNVSDGAVVKVMN